MMKMNRRDFLKGLMAVAGAAALAELPDLDFVQPQIPYLHHWPATSFHPAYRPYGQMGSVRLNDRWYKLDSGGITLTHHRLPTIYAPDPNSIGVYSPILPLRDQEKRYEVELYLSHDEIYDWTDSANGEVEFEIDSRYLYSFHGRGYVTEISFVNIMPDYESFPSNSLNLEVIGEIKRI